MKRLFSGIQPTGDIHLGNYLGALKNWLKLQDEYEAIYCLVDLHAITIDYEPKLLQQRILETAADLIAIGINPKKATLFVQSHIPEHSELAWLFNTITPLAELERMTQFKEKSSQHAKNINAGLLNYPVLQAADILLYKAEAVPVGEDQVQHIELARAIGRKFNTRFGNLFPEPKPILNRTARVMSLKDPTQKMSKSAGAYHYLALSDPAQTIREKVSQAVTDKGPGTGPMSPGTRNLFTLLSELAGPGTMAQFEREYYAKTISYAKMKETLAEAIIKTLEPIQRKRTELLKNPSYLKEVLKAGAEKLRPIAQETMGEVKGKMGLL